MMTIFRRLFQPIAVLLFILLVLSGCAKTNQLNVEENPNLLRVGVSPDAPPLIFKQNEKIVGLEADLAASMAAYLGKELVMVERVWNDLIPSLLDNQFDIIMSGMSFTVARQQEIAFSKPYFKSGLMILAKDLHKYTYITSAEAVMAQSVTWRIGVVKGTTGEIFVRQKSKGAKSMKSFSNQEEALNALLGGRIDVFIHDAPMILMMAGKYQTEGVKPLPVMLNEEYLAWGMRKTDPELIASVNAFLDQAKSDQTLHNTTIRWIPLAK
jgi:ABC-type amino acid transport substrate-binding protein